MGKKRNMSGSNNPMFGKNHSKESKTKISQANKGKLSGDKNPMFAKQRSNKIKEILSEYRIGSVWMFNDELKKCKQISKDKVIDFQIDGWTRGRRRYT